jgi:hypothetical protein
MANIIIKRCPVCPNIDKRAKEVRAALADELGVPSQIVDGGKGEFSVLVGGVPMIQRDEDSLPSVEEVEAAVRNADPAPMGT